MVGDWNKRPCGVTGVTIAEALNGYKNGLKGKILYQVKEHNI